MTRVKIFIGRAQAIDEWWMSAFSRNFLADWEAAEGTDVSGERMITIEENSYIVTEDTYGYQVAEVLPGFPEGA